MTNKMKDLWLPIALGTVVLAATAAAAPSLKTAPGSQESTAQERTAPTPPPASQETFTRALSLYRHRRFREALTELEKVAQAEPSRADVHYLIGYCHLMLKEFQQSLDAFRQAFEQDPSFDPRTIYQAK